MKKKLIKRILLVIAGIFVFIAAAAAIIPLFISPDPIEGLAAAEVIKKPDSLFINVAFEGTDGIKIHYMDKGRSDFGEPVFVLLHGSMYNLFTWNEVFDAFAANGRTVAYDQAPYGLSEKLTEGDWSKANPYTQEAAVKQLIAFLDELNLEKVYLVGSSYGGTLAVRTAVEYKDRVAGLILVDPAVFVSESMPGWLVGSRQMNNAGPLFARMMGSGTSFYENCYADPAVFSGRRMEDSMIMSKVRDWDFALWQYLKAWAEVSFDFESRIPEISVPALIVSGEEDRVVPVEDSRKLNDMLPDSELHFIPDTGHLPHEESPEQFLEIVLPWIENISSQGASK